MSSAAYHLVELGIVALAVGASGAFMLRGWVRAMLARFRGAAPVPSAAGGCTSCNDCGSCAPAKPPAEAPIAFIRRLPQR